MKKDKNYEVALKAFKGMLQIAWNYKILKKEFVAYEMLSLTHFHLGNLGKASFYKDRQIKGLAENETSRVQLLSRI